MCNFCSVYTTQEAMRRAFEVSRDSAGNVPTLPAIFPDRLAHVVRLHEDERELTRLEASWTGVRLTAEFVQDVAHLRPSVSKVYLTFNLTCVCMVQERRFNKGLAVLGKPVSQEGCRELKQFKRKPGQDHKPDAAQNFQPMM